MISEKEDLQTWVLSGQLDEHKGSKTIERKPTKAESEEDEEYKEKLKKLDLAKKEAITGFNKELYTVETSVPFLNRIKKKYDLKELYVQQKGRGKAELVGKINPKFEEMLEIIRDDYTSGEREPLDESQQVYSLFRAMKLAELESMRKQGEITVLSHEKNRKKKKKKKAVKKGDPKGQPFLATDPEYSKKLMKRKWELGESENDEEIKKQYEYLVQIDFVPGTEEVLKDPAIAHFERDDDVSRREFEPLGFKAKEEGKRGFILLKLEPKAEKGKRESVLNYGITPESWNISDPLNITNNQIARIKVIARIVE
ncbi:MAG: Unknown protein [uncultured Sulfurovum sp.]|uniref:Uncharacterized protein n=1 Tax=uncultured Sulfurovum sp. TaxID=269237 RepID=A0A6S6UBD6_9BACT|nr:MAG: Unknown protein [uncultured Sulfurovum sp.]